MKEKKEYMKYCVELMQKNDDFESYKWGPIFTFDTLKEALDFIEKALLNSTGVLAYIYELEEMK